ncbi:WD40 repeat domain-containing protein [Thermodesulfobium sp. 4217-1]|uniref:WD40 repeat domain-containing protein n=1 Tax=Thermodesulfobium sp. 4217-1 TaxID=3120013 RepID=UPI0032214CF2
MISTMDAASYFLKLANQKSLYISGKIDIGAIDLASCSNDNKFVGLSSKGNYSLYSIFENKIAKTWQDTSSSKIFINSRNSTIYQTLSGQIKIIDFDKSSPKTISSDMVLADFNDKYVVSYSESNILALTEIDNPSNIKNIRLPENFTVKDIVLKNNALLIGEINNRVFFIIYELHSITLPQPQSVPDGSVYVGSSDDFEYIAFRSDNAGLNIFNTKDPSKSYNIPIVESKTKKVYFSKDKTLIVIVDFDEYISFWWTNKELNTGNEPIFKQKICGNPLELTFSENGNVSSLITYKNNFLKIWLPASKTDRLDLTANFKSDESDSFLHNGYFLDSVSFTEKNEAVCLFIKPRWESKILKFDLYNRLNINCENVFKESLVNSGILSNNSKLLATLRNKNKIKIINTQSNSIIQEFAIKDESINTLCFSPDQRFLILGGSTLRIWSIDKEIIVKSVFPEHPVSFVAVSPNSDLIAFSQKVRDNIILSIMDLNTKEVKRKFDGLNNVNSLVFSPNSKFLFVGSTKKDPLIRAYSVDTGNQVFSYQTNYIDVNDMCISSSGTHLFFGGSDEKIYVFDLRKTKIIKILNGHYDIIKKISISENDRFLISSSNDERLCVWKVADYI